MLTTIKRGEVGFTLVELMIVIAVFAVILGIAIPSFNTYMASERARTATYSLQVSLSAARSEAIKRNRSVEVVPTSTSDWALGWTGRVVSDTTKVFVTQNALTAVTISGPTSVVYTQNGRSSNTSTVKFTVAPSSTSSGGTTRCLYLDTIGLPVVKAKTGATC